MEQIQKLSLLIDSSQAHIECLQKLTILSHTLTWLGGKSIQTILYIVLTKR